jgi:hypothetical protein
MPGACTTITPSSPSAYGQMMSLAMYQAAIHIRPNRCKGGRAGRSGALCHQNGEVIGKRRNPSLSVSAVSPLTFPDHEVKPSSGSRLGIVWPLPCPGGHDLALDRRGAGPTERRCWLSGVVQINTPGCNHLLGWR